MQFERFRFLQTTDVRPHDIRDAVNSLDVCRDGGDAQITAAGNFRVRRKRVAHVRANDLIAADVVKPRIGIVDFDELQISPVQSRRGLEHDF